MELKRKKYFERMQKSSKKKKKKKPPAGPLKALTSNTFFKYLDVHEAKM